MRTIPLMLALLAACTPAGPGQVDDGVDDDVIDQTPVENPYGTADACPAFATGTAHLQAAGLDRRLEVELPADPVGAPVVFVWHWLGGNAEQTLDWLPMRDLADDGYIVVAPETSGLPFEWDVSDPSDNNIDLVLFDEALTCLWDAYGTDTDRVYATGMSAGGLMTTWLTMHRAEHLAATAPFSGGAGAQHYDAPDRDIPVMVTWGGSSDSYGGYNFHNASLDFLELLDSDGHYTVGCMHNGGHLPPAEAVDMARDFFDDHLRGERSPWESEGLPSALPGFCE